MNKLSVLRPDPASPTPLYLQIANKLTMAIQAGYWLANQPLPSERALVEAFGISQSQATHDVLGFVTELDRSGLLERS